MNIIRGNVINEKEIADDFYEAYKRCFEANKNGNIVSIPGFVNGFFACELYMKYLIDDKEKIKGHNLGNFFSLLDISIQEQLKSIDCDPRFSLEDLLHKVGEGFVQWRYIFEEGNENFGNNHPFQYSEYFLQTYLPVLSNLANKKYLESVSTE